MGIKGIKEKTHCLRGHERTPENVSLNGACKICIKTRDRSRYAESNPTTRSHNFKDIIGQTFGQWTVLHYTRTDPRGAFWMCKCSCGAEHEVWGKALRKGNSKCCERCAHNFKLPDEEASKRRLYGVYRNQAKKRKRAFELSIEEFSRITKEKCNYCGKEPSQECIRRDRVVTPAPYIYNGIDRVNSKGGYTLANSVPCCVTCNRAKLAMSLDEFLSWVNRVVNYQNLKVTQLASENNNVVLFENPV